jgi:hypothetical protein
VQVVLALIVTPEGLPVAYEVFDGNRVDVTTLQPMMDHVEARHGKMGRVWVFDRGIVSEANLSELRARGGHYLVGTPRSALGPREAHLLAQDWQAVSPEVEVKLLPEDRETYVLARSRPRAAKEQAMRTRIVRGLMRDLIRLRRSWQRGRVPADRVWMRLGGLEERHGRARHYVQVDFDGQKLMPAAVFDQLGRIQLVEVWFNLRDGRQLCLKRITQPEPGQVALLDALDWHLPEQPPPKIYPKHLPGCGQ